MAELEHLDGLAKWITRSTTDARGPSMPPWSTRCTPANLLLEAKDNAPHGLPDRSLRQGAR